MRKNMRQVLEQMEADLSGKRVFRYMEEDHVRDISGEQFFRDVRGAARQIREKGLAGSHIGIMGANSYQWMVCLCGVFWTGSTAVLLDREISSEILLERTERTDVKGLLYDKDVEEVCHVFSGIRIPMTRIPMARIPVEEKEPDTDPVLSGDRRDNEKDEDRLACIFFTSGTTGTSKAVMISERGLTAGICHRINDTGFRSLLAVLPFHHISGFTSVLNALYLGAEVCIAGDQKYFFRYLERMLPDYIFVVPSMLRMLAKKLEKGGKNGRLLGWDLHLINCGGAAFRPEFLQMLLDRDITVLQGYGASEAGSIGFLWSMTPDRPDTIGKPPEGLEARITDGELYLRSAAVMTGYYGDPEGTAQVLRDGWYATGDLARVDEEGYYYLTGRKKNLIILDNGENVSPEEIERRLCDCPDICEILAGEEENLIAAYVYPRYPRSCTEEEGNLIRERISRKIGEYNQSVPIYQQIRKIHFLDSPVKKTSSGKMIRAGAAERALTVEEAVKTETVTETTSATENETKTVIDMKTEKETL